ncbi:MAG: MATE family efflux transporter [Ruminococcaceae bacterium]|nr:MATE family efflux transporter [Oscillospiraceae bacterium]
MEIQLSDHFTYKRLLRFVAPSIFMMIFISIYGVIDGLFVSRFVGKTAFASINLVMPFIMILGGMGFMIGTGGTALVAKTLGEGDKARANRYFTMMVYFTLILGGILTVFGIAFMRPIAYFLGATDEMIGDCVVYGITVIAFTTSFMLQNLFQSFLVTAEKPKLGLWATVAAGVTNIVLDALFVAVFDMGVLGAAFATGISQCVGALIPLIYFFGKSECILKLTKTKLELRPIARACTNGSSELMNNISSSIVSMLYNFKLMDMLGENGVSAYGVIMYVQFIFVSIFIGYVIGAAPIIGYNYGAGNNRELQNIFKKSTVFMTISGVTLTLAAISLASPLAKIFVGYDKELFELTKHAFYLFSVSFILVGLNIFASNLFTSLNNGLISAVISFLRTLVFQTIAVLALPELIGADGIWYSIVIAEIAAFIISVICVIAYRNRYHYLPEKSLAEKN